MVALAAATLVLGGAAPAQAVDVPNGTFLTITAGQQVFGDVTSTGNGLLTCGTCALHTGTPGTSNNQFNMVYIDMDSDATTFNSSSASLTIPAGATVAHAWLMWEAGAGAGANPVTVATVRANAPLLSLDGGANVNVGVADYLSTTAVAASGVFNGAVDVTAELAGLTGGTHSVMLANLAASQGVGQTAGWSMHVTYDYGAFTPGNPDSQPRKIYTAFGMAGVFQSQQTVTFSGFQTTAPGATFLLTASDGEPQAADTATALWSGGSEVLPNPLGATNNAFNSFMNGANSYAPGVSNAAFHNGSFDTYKTQSLNLPTGSTSVDFRFLSLTQGDGFFAHSVSMAVPIAQISVAKSAASGTADGQIVSTGESPVFQIVITNESAVEVSGVTFVDANATGCTLNGTPLAQAGDTFTLPAPLPAASVTTVLCNGPVVVEGDANYVNTVTVSGTDPNGAPVTDEDDSPVFIPHLSLTKSVDRPAVEEGETVTWTITVVNDGGTDLRNVVVGDTNCAGPLTGPVGAGAPDLLEPGVTWTYTCTQPVLIDTTNTADVTAEPFTTVDGEEIVGDPLSDSDDELVTVTPAPEASVSLTKSADPTSVVEGGTVTWTMVVTNDGLQDLRDVVLTDTDCTGTLSAPTGPGAPTVLAIGDSWTYTCSEPVEADKTNTASVTATPFRTVNGVDIEDDPVSDEDDADVTTTPPVASVSVEKSVDRASVITGETVTWTMVVTNDGAQDLRNVLLDDSNCSGSLSTPTGPGAPTTLAQGDAWTYTCSEPVTADTTNTATVTATPFRTVSGEEIESPEITADDDATVTVVPVPEPQITLTKTVDDDSVPQARP